MYAVLDAIRVAATARILTVSPRAQFSTSPRIVPGSTESKPSAECAVRLGLHFLLEALWGTQKWLLPRAVHIIRTLYPVAPSTWGEPLVEMLLNPEIGKLSY